MARPIKARPDVNAVVHSHSPTVIPFTVTGEPLKAISHIASFLANGCPCFEIRDVGLTQGLLVTNNKQGDALAKTLGNNPVALMRGHGNLVVAQDIPRVVHRALYTEVNAQQLAIALSFNRPITFVAPDEEQDPARLGDSWERVEARGAEGKVRAIIPERRSLLCPLPLRERANVHSTPDQLGEGSRTIESP